MWTMAGEWNPFVVYFASIIYDLHSFNMPTNSFRLENLSKYITHASILSACEMPTLAHLSSSVLLVCRQQTNERKIIIMNARKKRNENHYAHRRVVWQRRRQNRFASTSLNTPINTHTHTHIRRRTSRTRSVIVSRTASISMWTKCRYMDIHLMLSFTFIYASIWSLTFTNRIKYTLLPNSPDYREWMRVKTEDTHAHFRICLSLRLERIRGIMEDEVSTTFEKDYHFLFDIEMDMEKNREKGWNPRRATADSKTDENMHMEFLCLHSCRTRHTINSHECAFCLRAELRMCSVLGERSLRAHICIFLLCASNKQFYLSRRCRVRSHLRILLLMHCFRFSSPLFAIENTCFSHMYKLGTAEALARLAKEHTQHMNFERLNTDGSVLALTFLLSAELASQCGAFEIPTARTFWSNQSTLHWAIW